VIYVIAPHSRPEHAARLLESFDRQSVRGRLIVVENGPAVGTFPASRAHAVIRCERAHHAAAKNAALDWIEARGDGAPWVTMDDDDYYGPEYLADTLAVLERADVTGKVRGFVAFDDGLWRFAPGFDGGACGGRILTGGTIGARATRQRFQCVTDDDRRYCDATRAAGLRIEASPPRGYCYDRRTTHAHAWAASQTAARLSFGAAEYYGLAPPYAVDYPERLIPLRIVPPPSDAEVLASLDLQ
jgi:hypothetical protein